MSFSDVTLERMKGWSEKYKKSMEELTDLMNASVGELTQLHPGHEDAWYESRARFQVYRSIKTASRSPSIPFHVVWFGSSDKRNIWAARVRQAATAFKDPAQRNLAIAQGLVTAEGIPLDTRGRQIKGPTYIRNVVGFGYPVDKGDPKLIFMGASGAQADVPPPELVALEARLNLREARPNVYWCTSSTLTEWTPVEVETLKNVCPAWAADMLSKAPDALSSTCKGLRTWHKKNVNNQQRVVIVEADVMDIATTPSSIGNFALNYEDETIYDSDDDSFLAWITGEQNDKRDWDKGSRIYLLGRTALSPAFNRETRQPDPTKLVVLINALALVVIPEFRIPREEIDVVDEAA